MIRTFARISVHRVPEELRTRRAQWQVDIFYWEYSGGLFADSRTLKYMPSYHLSFQCARRCAEVYYKNRIWEWES